MKRSIEKATRIFRTTTGKGTLTSGGTSRKALFSSISFSDWTKEQFKALVLILAGFSLLMILTAVAFFFFTLRGAERTLVPEVKGLELPEAMVLLQEKELYPRLNLRYTDNPADRNKILEQNPAAGTIVKAGRRISLTVSRGTVVQKIEDYRGKSLDEARLRLQSLFASSSALVTIREPVIYAWDNSDPGTILEQSPGSGTDVSGPMELQLIVSKGPEKVTMQAPELLSRTLGEAVSMASSGAVSVDFSFAKPESGQRPGMVVAQNPAPGTQMNASDHLAVTVTLPTVKEGSVAGIFAYKLPLYPYPVQVSVVATTPSGDRTALFSGKHSGGAFSVPYSLPAGSMIVLSVLDREVAKAEASAGE